MYCLQHTTYATAPKLCARTKYGRCKHCDQGALPSRQLGYAGLHFGGAAIKAAGLCRHASLCLMGGIAAQCCYLVCSSVLQLYTTLYQDMLVCAHFGIGACGASIHELVSGATLAQDKNCGFGLHPSHSLVFPHTTLGEQSLCYCSHAVSIKLHQTHDWAVSLGWGLQFMNRF